MDLESNLTRSPITPTSCNGPTSTCFSSEYLNTWLSRLQLESVKFTTQKCSDQEVCIYRVAGKENGTIIGYCLVVDMGSERQHITLRPNQISLPNT